MQRYIYKVPVIDTKTLGIHKGRPHFFPIFDPPPPCPEFVDFSPSSERPQFSKKVMLLFFKLYFGHWKRKIFTLFGSFLLFFRPILTFLNRSYFHTFFPKKCWAPWILCIMHRICQIKHWLNLESGFLQSIIILMSLLYWCHSKSG